MSIETTAEVPVSTDSRPTLGRIEIPIGPNIVRVSWAEFKPENQEGLDLTKAVIFLPGWPWKADKSATWDMPRSFAQAFSARTFNIDTRTDNKDDALYNETEGIAQFIKQNGINEVTIFGHSEGGIRAANLAVVLEKEHPQVKINGVVLANSVGLGEMSLSELMKNFIFDVIKVAPAERKRMGTTPPKGGEIQFVQTLLSDIAYSWLKYPKMLMDQLKAMARKNPHLADIKAPVAVIATDKDFVSDIRKYAPVEGELTAQKPEEQLREEVANSGRWEKLSPEEQAKYKGKEDFVEQYIGFYRTRERMAQNTKARKEYLKENAIPNTENIEVLVGTKFADHTGIPVSRYEQTARILYGMFNRIKRQNSTKS